MDWPLPLRPLPRFVAPFRDETTTSHLHRLAEANRLDPAWLRGYLAGSDRKDATVNCMEPYHPFPGKDGQRTGVYVRRPLSFFSGSEEIGIGCLPLADAFKQMQ